MQLNPSEISELIRTKIQNLEIGAEVRTQGTVVSLSDGIARVHGLADAMQGEMLEFPANTYGLALNLERDSVGVVILGDYEHISEGDTVKCTGRILEVPVGPELMGRVVDALGQPIDGKGPINARQTDVIEKVAPGVIFVELKAVEKLLPLHIAQLLSYLKLSGRSVGLLINFNVPHLRQGIKHVVSGYGCVPEKDLPSVSSVSSVVESLGSVGTKATETS